MDDHEDEGEDDAGEKDEDAAELVNQEPAKAEGGNHHHRWVVLLQGFHLHLGNYYMVEIKQNTNEMMGPLTKIMAKRTNFVDSIPDLVWAYKFG